MQKISDDNLSLEKEDWVGIRNWCIWYLDLFLTYSDKLNSKRSYTEYHQQLQERSIKWKRVKKLQNENIRVIIEIITSVVSEAVPAKNVRPGDFEDTVEAAKKWKEVLEKGDLPEVAVKEIMLIEESC